MRTSIVLYMILWCLLFVPLCAPLFAQALANKDVKSLVAKIEEGFGLGNAHTLSEWLAPRVAITIDGRTQNYTKKQTQAVLKAFFDKEAPVEFSTIHYGGVQKDLLSYYIARYVTATKTYSLYILLKPLRSGAYKIHKMDISSEGVND